MMARATQSEPAAHRALSKGRTVSMAGIAGALVPLGLIVALLQWFALRLPLRPVFLITSAMLLVMGLRCVGGAMQHVHEQALFPVTPLARPA